MSYIDNFLYHKAQIGDEMSKLKCVKFGGFRISIYLAIAKLYLFYRWDFCIPYR